MTVNSRPMSQGEDPTVSRPGGLACGSAAEYRVSEAEAGQKLLQFLQRRLQLPQSLLHRWLRTGQVRLNGGRCKPFVHVEIGDSVRLPPFALKLAAQARAEAAPHNEQTSQPSGGALPPLMCEKAGILAFCKPAGLPVHGGTGHSTSLASLLAAHFAQADFCPTPVHRLDKDTSGLLLVAASYAALRDAQESLRNGLWHKEYLAWVRGRWPWPEDRLLQHALHKATTQGFEKMHALPLRGSAPLLTPHCKEARCLVRCLATRQQGSLVQVRLLTGRTHQIRVQLAEMGHPVLGDSKYGGHGRLTGHLPYRQSRQADANTPVLLLHSMRICLPDGHCFTSLPDWPKPFTIDSLPAPLEAAVGINEP